MLNKKNLADLGDVKVGDRAIALHNLIHGVLLIFNASWTRF